MSTNTYVALQTQVLSSSASSITFTSIPQTYTDLRLVVTLTSATNGSSPAMRFNADSGTNYSNTYISGNGSTASSNRLSNQSLAYLASATGTATGSPMFVTGDIFSYAGSTYKTYLSTASNVSGAAGGVERDVGLWRNTAAITSITIILDTSANFAIGTTATIYGIQAA